MSKFKKAICCRCGKDLKDKVPADAENVTCFTCYNADPRALAAAPAKEKE